MKVTTIGRKVSLKDAFLERVDNKLAKLDKFFSDNAAATVTVTVEKKWQTVEIAIKDRKLMFRSEKSADSMELALDDADGYAYFDDLPSTDEDEDYEIVRKKVFALQPQSVDDAILEMNMLGHTFFMFKDIVTEEINVVYKRKDGKYGLLLPE